MAFTSAVGAIVLQYGGHPVPDLLPILATNAVTAISGVIVGFARPRDNAR